MLDTAEYFEQRRELDKAVLLYQKAGKERRALELCFSANLFDTLATIANNLTDKSDPAVMARCGKPCREVAARCIASMEPSYAQNCWEVGVEIARLLNRTASMHTDSRYVSFINHGVACQ